MIEKRNSGAKAAAGIAAVCVFTYFVSYYIRNLLSVSTPEMLTYGFNKEFIGTLSFLCGVPWRFSVFRRRFWLRENVKKQLRSGAPI